MMLQHEGWEPVCVRSIAQHRDEPEALRVVSIADQSETNFAIDPGLDPHSANVDDHGGGLRNGLFHSCHPGSAWLLIGFIEPDSDAISTEDFRELVCRLRVRPSMAEK